MQLVRIKLLSDFRSLKRNFEMRFPQDPVPNEDQTVSPICLVGKNGYGKSNLLELLCEIFYYLDSLLLEYPAESLLSRKEFGFELEYKLFTDETDPLQSIIPKEKQSSNQFQQVKVVKKTQDEEPSYFIVSEGKKDWSIKTPDDTKRELREKIKLLLPSKVVGYSSGLNELVSTPFLKMQFHYFNEYVSRLQEDVLDGFDDGRLFYMDYESNAAIVVANFLLQPASKMKILDEVLEITGLHSFRITIEFGNTIEINADARSTKESADVTDYFRRQIQLLKQIATAFQESKVEDTATNEQRTVLTLDFKVTKALQDGFKHIFGDAYSLFSFFHRMQLLNLLKIPAEKRDAVRNASRGISVLNLLPKLSTDQLLFRIERIRLEKSSTEQKLDYKNISDGEHQFMHIIGTSLLMNNPKSLFILDEPETHFNPRWRSKLVNTLNKIEKADVEIQKLNNSPTPLKSKEILLTTHSPFVLSDSYNLRVWKFFKDDGIPGASTLEIKTYGTSFSTLLDEAFDKSESISEMASEYIDRLRQQIESIENLEGSRKLIEQYQQKVLELGESVEKFELYSYLNSLITELFNESR